MMRTVLVRHWQRLALLLVLATLGVAAIRFLPYGVQAADKPLPGLIRSVQSGSWSAAATWEGGKVPAAGSRVQVRQGHTVTYDLKSEHVIRSIHVAGTLTFATDKDTRLDVGLIKIQPGDDASEDGFDCDAHVPTLPPGQSRPALLVGTPEQPVVKHSALIRLHYVEGMDKQSCPAIVCCGGRLDLHGAPLNRTWVKLGATAKKGDSAVTLAEPVTGWRVGDRLVVTATQLTYDNSRGLHSSEERILQKIEGAELTLDKPLELEHLGIGDYRGEVANHRWLTIHGTNYLVVRDCVGYQSIGHGFFLEDGTEVYNVLDRNLAVQAFIGRPLPKQVFPFDKNDGSGFWWANSHNSFLRNVACECDEYGYFFQAAKTAHFDPVLSIQRPDGSFKKVDIRTLPFVRFEDNEAHCQRRHAFNLGGGVPFGEPNVGGVGPDERHPFVIRNMKLWNVHWAIHPVSPSVLLDNLDIHDAEYGVWRPIYQLHAYRNVRMDQVPDRTQYAFVNGSPGNKEADFPKPLAPVDDLPPITVITHVSKPTAGKWTVRGTVSDNGTIKRVLVNGKEARSLTANFGEWEVVLDADRAGEAKLTAHAEDIAGNIEKRPHVLVVNPAR